MKLTRFLAQVDIIAGPMLANVSSRIAIELIVGFRDGVSLTDGGHDLGNYLRTAASALSANWHQFLPSSYTAVTYAATRNYTGELDLPRHTGVCNRSALA